VLQVMALSKGTVVSIGDNSPAHAALDAVGQHALDRRTDEMDGGEHVFEEITRVVWLSIVVSDGDAAQPKRWSSADGPYNAGTVAPIRRR
jgi:hypothetical protein